MAGKQRAVEGPRNTNAALPVRTHNSPLEQQLLGTSPYQTALSASMQMPSGRCVTGVDHVLNRQELRWFISQSIHTCDTPSYTDQYAVYTGVIPAAQHKAITKHARQTNHIERFNNTLRQRVSRLVRETLAF